LKDVPPGATPETYVPNEDAAPALAITDEPYMSVVTPLETMLEIRVEAMLEAGLEARVDSALSEITLLGVSRLYHGVAEIRAGRRAKRIGIE